jgi:prepilin peptidase CpaA
MVSLATATVAATFPVLIVWAGAVDAVTRSIPNAVVAVLAVSFAGFAAIAGLPILEVLAHFACALAVLAGGFVLFFYSLLGGGDAKLLAAAALWFGFEDILPFLAAVALAGGLFTLIYIAATAIRSRYQETSGRLTIPYGAAIAAGALAVLPDWIARF